MRKTRFWQHRAGRHGLGWLGALALLGVLAWQEANPVLRVERVSYSVLSLGVLALAVYAHFWLLPRLLERGRYAWHGLATLALLAAGGHLLTLGAQALHRLLHDRGGYGAGVFLGALNLGLGVALATALHYARQGLVSRFELHRLRAERLETELRVLKSQVNHHFLFNTLNNLYGLSLAQPERIPRALLQLAGLMRYQLDHGRPRPVTVGSEAEYLANYIGLEKLRLRPNARVELHVQVPYPDQPLAPLLLLPLVENCFKHAIGPGGAATSIRICLTQTATTLTLRTENSLPPHFRPVPSGLGLPNLRARLAQHYPAPRHVLALDARPDHYTARLTLTLSR
ncbi:sensor histidine kinase [Hymenobacter arizonensis]|uniref:Histidine kinase n=1 Tax=Hymenobacter arizonensis TaxID=1227077 RepID=A0A1I6BE84_HYMAR|nr:sensor histidine kinase [Hymenobacter arizonensis]SFQ79189.1 Histidine kinase [Hymenobacter arizonensis]